MAPDSRPVFHGDGLSVSRPVGTGRPVAGGVDFDGAASCSQIKADGSPCRAHASEDGLCIGHRRQVKAGQ